MVLLLDKELDQSTPLTAQDLNFRCSSVVKDYLTVTIAKMLELDAIVSLYAGHWRVLTQQKPVKQCPSASQELLLMSTYFLGSYNIIDRHPIIE